MKTYTGTKLVKAKPMTRKEYNDLRGWTVPADEDPDDAGYLVEYLDGGSPNVAGFDGYVSWSPLAQFEKAYVDVGDVSGLLPHQRRVVAERAELEDRIGKLFAFLLTDVCMSLPFGERGLLSQQHNDMCLYSETLGQRISGFKQTTR